MHDYDCDFSALVIDDVKYCHMTRGVFSVIVIYRILQMLINFAVAGIVLYLTCAVVNVHSITAKSNCMISLLGSLVIAINVVTLTLRMEDLMRIFTLRREKSTTQS